MSRLEVEREWTARSGVTILEVLIVLAIIAMVAAVAGPRLIGYLGRAKVQTAELQIGQIKSALQLFYIDVGRYPAAAEGLAVLTQPPAAAESWAGPYLESEEALIDPWGRDYLYAVTEGTGTPGISSLGRDGAKGGSGEDADVGP